MRAAVFREQGRNPEIEEWPEPEAGSGEVKVAVRAAALNHRDVWIVRGKYPGVAPPVVLGSDAVGELDGRRVVINPALFWGDREDMQSDRFEILGNPRAGTFAEYTVVPRENVFDCPEHLTNAEAAALPLAGLTAYRALFTRASAKTGETVLVTGAGGGVSSFTIQFAVAAGCRVFVNSSSEEKIEESKELGVEGGVLYTEADWAKQLKELIGGGIDAVVDGAGGAGVAAIAKLLNPAGRIAFYGGTAGPVPELSPQALFYKQATLAGTTMGSPREFAAMLDFVSEHEIQPVVDSVQPLERVGRAFERMAAGKQHGKVVLSL